MLQIIKRTVTGDCEASHFDGKGVNVLLTQVGSGQSAMLLCAECLLKEQLAEESTHKTVIQSRKVDALLELKQDVFVAATVPFTELSALIMADESIPANKKNEAILQETDRRIQKMSASIFEHEKELVAEKNARHAMHIHAQEVAGRLSAEARAKYKQYDINYVSNSPTKKEKTVKPVKTAKAGYNKTEFNAACEKYNIPVIYKPRVQSMVINRKISADQAAKEFAAIMGFTS